MKYEYGELARGDEEAARVPGSIRLQHHPRPSYRLSSLHLPALVRRPQLLVSVISFLLGASFVYTWQHAVPANRLPDVLAVMEPNVTSAEPRLIGGAPVRMHYYRDGPANMRIVEGNDPCPIRIINSDEFAAEVVIYNSDEGLVMDEGGFEETRKARPWQYHAIKGVESASNRQWLETHYALVDAGKKNETYDYEMGYRLESAVPMPYAYSFFNFSNEPTPYELKQPHKLASTFISNCMPRNSRNLILDELIRLLPGQIDSFGPCRNTADAVETLKEVGIWDEEDIERSNWNTKVAVSRLYKFSLAMENSNAHDYVTEKYFQGLEMGSVPIYLGAPNFSPTFLPSPNAALNLADYLPPSHTSVTKYDDEAPGELDEEAKEGLARFAEELKRLGSKEGREDYNRMLDWKINDVWKETTFGKVVKLGRGSLSEECRLGGVVRGLEWAMTGWKDLVTEA